MCDPFGTGKAQKQAAALGVQASQIGSQAAQTGSAQQADKIQQGLNLYTETYLPKAASYTDPYAQAGQPGVNWLAQTYGPQDQQQQALATYLGNPSNNLLQLAMDDAARRQQGESAAVGMGRSGSDEEAMVRRLYDLRSRDYDNYANRAQGLAGLGVSAAGTGANLYNQAGQYMAQGYGDIGAVQNAGIVGFANAQMQGLNAEAQGIINANRAKTDLWNTGINLLGTGVGTALGGGFGASLGNYLMPKTPTPTLSGWGATPTYG